MGRGGRGRGEEGTCAPAGLCGRMNSARGGEYIYRGEDHLAIHGRKRKTRNGSREAESNCTLGRRRREWRKRRRDA